VSEDLELLKLAAKAARIREFDEHQSVGSKTCGLLVRRELEVRYDAVWWNPLKDDGDALRLLIELDGKVETLVDYGTGVIAMVYHGAARGRAYEKIGDDQAAAVRRAIVCAAAEIGRAMP
jgi:hypothetical protein